MGEERDRLAWVGWVGKEGWITVHIYIYFIFGGVVREGMEMKETLGSMGSIMQASKVVSEVEDE